jgi:hypothetical protein
MMGGFEILAALVDFLGRQHGDVAVTGSREIPTHLEMTLQQKAAIGGCQGSVTSSRTNPSKPR